MLTEAAITEKLFDMMMKPLWAAVEKEVMGTVEGFLVKRRVRNAVEKAVISVAQPMEAFLRNEKISIEKQQLLVAACERELNLLVLEPRRLFAGSLNGARLFDEIYGGKQLPAEIREEGLERIYTSMLPQILQVFCGLLPVFDLWKLEGFQEQFHRLDEIAQRLSEVLSKLQTTEDRSTGEAGTLLGDLRRVLRQRDALMDLTALRSDAMRTCKFEDLYVQPYLVDKKVPPTRLEEAGEVLDRFLGAGTRSVIIGSPGGGKSTWMRWMEREAHHRAFPGVVLRVELREELRRSANLSSWMDMFRHRAGTHMAAELTDEVLKRWRSEGKVAALVDGFDEVPAHRREEAYDWLVGLSLAIGRGPLLLSSRPLTTDHLARLGWPMWTLAPFDGKRIEEYIGRWYTCAELPAHVDRKVDATALTKRWGKDPTIAPLTGTPLLLATLLMVHVLDGSLPAGRAKLYQRYVDGMVGVWDQRNQRIAPKVLLTPDQKRRLLRDLALWMFLKEKDRVEEAEVCELLSRSLVRDRLEVDPLDVLAVLRERTGLLIGPEIYSFSHKSVAEFLVAEAIVDGGQRDERGERIDRMRLYRERYNDRWNVVVFLWAGLASTTEFEALVDDVAKEDTGDAWELVLGLMDDQMEKTSVDLWKRNLNQFKEFKIKPLKATHFVVAGIKLPAPSMRLRGPAGIAQTHQFLYKAMSRGFETFPDAGRPSPNAALRWHIATNHPHSITWIEALNAPLGWEEFESQWVQVAIGWRFNLILEADQGRGELLVEAHRLWPELYNMMAESAFYSISSHKEQRGALLALSKVEIGKIHFGDRDERFWTDPVPFLQTLSRLHAEAPMDETLTKAMRVADHIAKIHLERRERKK